MKKIIAIASAAILGLSVAACDSSKENAAEEAAVATDQATEAAADSAVAAGKITDEQSDKIQQDSEVKKDAAEDKADKMDSGTPE